MLDLGKLRDFFTYTVKVWLPDDEEAWKEYNTFKRKFMDPLEVSRRGASYPADYETGTIELNVNTELPVIVFYDSNDTPVSHEVYYGKIPSDFTRRKWRNLR